MAQLFQLRLPDGRMVAPGDYTTAEPLYSTVELAAGPFNVLTAFSYGRGGDVPGSVGPRQSNWADTNLEGEGNRIPENEEIFIYSLAVEMFMLGSENAADVGEIPASQAPFVSLRNMLRLQSALLVTTRIGADSKRYTHAPVGFFPGGTGVDQYVAGGLNNDGTTGFFNGNNGGPNSYDARMFASPLHVAGGETFGVDFTPGPGQIPDLNLDPAPQAGVIGRIRLRVFCEGLRRRPIA